MCCVDSDGIIGHLTAIAIISGLVNIIKFLHSLDVPYRKAQKYITVEQGHQLNCFIIYCILYCIYFTKRVSFFIKGLKPYFTL